MDKKKFIALVDKYLDGETSPAEEQALFQRYDELQETEPEWDVSAMGEKPVVEQRLYHNILQEINWLEKRNIKLD